MAKIAKGEEASSTTRAEGVVLCALGAEVTVFALPRVPTIVGRAEGCAIRIAHHSVSRKHARFEAGTIEDLGSRNGTRIAGRRLGKGERASVGMGSLIEIGDAMLVVQRSSAELEQRIARPTPAATPSRNVIAEDPTMRRVYALLDVVAPSELAVLVLGETGSGKEVFARAIHGRSGRAKMPFVGLDCVGLPETTLEAELFGREKRGLFEAANGGTLFLDGIGELPLATQAKLLHVLETGAVTRLGTAKAKRVDVRLVSTTNRDLAEHVRERTFRSDLLFRINGVTVTLPPLRHRTADVPPLVALILENAARKAGRAAPAITNDAMDALLGHRWPGNVRELERVLERALLFAKGPALRAADLDLHAPTLASIAVAPTKGR